MLKAITALDAVFLASVAGLVGSAAVRRWAGDTPDAPDALDAPDAPDGLAARPRSPALARWGAVGAWALFAGFWLGEVAAYLPEQRVFLAGVSAVTAGLSAYVATLAERDRGPHARLTAAFALMGLLFVPYQFVLPLFHTVLRAVTAHTIRGLGVVGFDPVVEVGVTGQPTAMRFENASFIRYNIVSACTGISAITLFAGLVGVADAPVRRRVGVAVVTGAVIYCANVVRTVLVGGSIGGEWFAFAAPVAGPLFGVTHPALVSFYVAEYVVAQALVVVALLGIYLALARRLPGVQRLVDDLLSSLAADVRTVRTLSRSGRPERQR